MFSNELKKVKMAGSQHTLIEISLIKRDKKNIKVDDSLRLLCYRARLDNEMNPVFPCLVKRDRKTRHRE